MDKPTADRHVYHWCGHYQEDGGDLRFFDGIAVMERKITSYEHYLILKKDVLINAGVDVALCGRLIIDSLSFIGMEQD